MTEAHFNKIIFKRKADPFWSEVLAVYMTPIPKENPIEYKTFRYVRNALSQKVILETMEKLTK